LARAQAWLWQALAAGIAVGGVLLLAVTAARHMAERGIASGFAYLDRPAGFDIKESLLSLPQRPSYLDMVLAGLANTLLVAVLGLILATLLGFAAGAARLSRNGPLRWLAGAYVHVFRNTPLLLQMVLLHLCLTGLAPRPQEAWSPLPHIFLSNRGLVLPWPGGPLPELGRYNISGGITLSPELVAVLLGLVFYTGAYIAEVVRGGIQSVAKGQWEAGRALGLREGAILRHVVLPQALRAIMPPLASQWLNLAKNSSLAAVVAYPDLVLVTDTTINQTGQALEPLALAMAVFLALSLSLSGLLNLYNRHLLRRRGAA
jgi:general L-amino acid transport system permease protein